MDLIMETSTRRPQLPALGYLDIDKVKREDDNQQHHHHARIPAPPPSSLPLIKTSASPTYYPPGPPPPYNPSSSHQTTSWSEKNGGVHTPPDSRRTSGDDVDNIKQTSRQALPSISDVLGVDRPPTLGSLYSIASAFHTSHTLPHSSSPSPTSNPTNPLPEQSTPPTNLKGAHTPYHRDRAWSDSLSSTENKNKTLAPLRDRSPIARVEPLTSARLSTVPLSSHRPAGPYDHGATSQPTTTMASATPAATALPPPPPPPTISTPYGYASYTPGPPVSTVSAVSATPGPIYQPSVTHPPPSWSSEPRTAKFATDSRHNITPAYGDSVKRHLDFFDLEAALNDIAAASGILADFTRRYGDRLHQTARTGPDMKSLPGLVEVDDMIVKSRVQLDSLIKIRDVVLTQQAAYDQQAADQRQRKAFDDSNNHNQESSLDPTDTKSNFLSADSKKRRGRAAPPGRCHSCNRAETPEWRRGPDGARTLCNACGLHYAKLTRKQQGTSKNASMGSSNLRPKSSLPDP